MICRICRKTEGDWPKGNGDFYHSCPLCREKKTGFGRSSNRDIACTVCGKLHTDKKANGYPYKLCKECREKGLESRQKFIKSREGLCKNCCIPIIDNSHTLCESCRTNNKLKTKEYRQKRCESGLCTQCGGPKEDSDIRRCLKCVLKDTALRCLGDRRRYEEIGDKFKKQGMRCIYSGRLLRLGVNASLDHKIPLCRGGNHEEANLQWVDMTVNVMKSKLTENEFFGLIKEIAKNIK